MTLRPIGLDRVRFEGGFWGPRLEANRAVALPHQYEQCLKTGRIGAWKLDWRPGRPDPPHVFWDSDVAKWLEAACYALAARPEPVLRRRVDGLVDLIVAAQQPDGYLNTHFTAVEPEMRWTNLRDAHELYCAGHLIEAAVAHHQATGERRLLDALCRYADLIGSVFGPGPGQRPGYPGHEEIELALVRLHRATGEGRYLDLARYFVDERGRLPHYFDAEAAARGEDPGPWREGKHDYNQSHLPAREQTTAEGHAVRAMYLYSAMVDLAAETGDRPLLAACRRLWRSVTERRMYVTGAVGSSARGERFTSDYDLPNETAYAETCASIGLVLWAHRMLNLERDGRYADVMERALYNGALGGVSLDGRSYYYANPPAVRPGRTGGDAARFPAGRQPWFGCACCPPNLARLLASLGRYAFAEAPREAWVHLYAQGRAEFELKDGPVALEVTTGYPWDEEVRIAVRAETPARWTLALRMPGWCRGPRIAVNGRRAALSALLGKGYARIGRTWTDGDEVELTLPMPVERVRSHPRVSADAGRVALARGPLVYCLEEADNGPDLDAISLPRRAPLKAGWRPRLLGGIVAMTGTARRIELAPWRGRLYRRAAGSTREASLLAVPFFARANRRAGEMLVWMREG